MTINKNRMNMKCRYIDVVSRSLMKKAKQECKAVVFMLPCDLLGSKFNLKSLTKNYI